MTEKLKAQALRMTVATNLKAIRHERGLSQEELADLIGLHRTYVGSVERGERNVSIDNIERFARGLKVSPKDFLEERKK